MREALVNVRFQSLVQILRWSGVAAAAGLVALGMDAVVTDWIVEGLRFELTRLDDTLKDWAVAALR